ncbi:hypothetical protein Dsin_023017, partial [Dipteronia sinensis]
MVLETGVSLGIDFNGKVKEIEEVIARRLGREEKMRVIRSLVKLHKPTVLLIQETKLKVFNRSVVRKLGGSWLTRGVGMDAEGAAGGLITLWKEESFVAKACIMAKSCIILAGQLVNLNREVMDLPLHGLNFTWSNNREREAWARLDRFLVSPEFMLWLPNLIQKGLERILSDHFPILLGETKKDWGPSPFRFYNSWIENKVLMNEAMKGWKNCKVTGSKGVVLRSKVKASKSSIKTWLLMHKRTVEDSKAIEAQLGLIDKSVAQDGWTELNRIQRWRLMEELWKSLRREEQLWCQKTRVSWLKEGDRNTKFFHLMANGRRKVNTIGEISIEGVACSNPEEIKDGIYRFFKNHFKKDV